MRAVEMKSEYLIVGTDDDDYAMAQAEEIKRYPTLTSVSISDINLGDAGTLAIAEALKVTTLLRDLNLSSNKISDAGALAIAEAIKVKAVPTMLKLWDNMIGAAGTTVLDVGSTDIQTYRHTDLRTYRHAQKHLFSSNNCDHLPYASNLAAGGIGGDLG